MFDLEPIHRLVKRIDLLPGHNPSISDAAFSNSTQETRRLSKILQTTPYSDTEIPQIHQPTLKSPIHCPDGIKSGHTQPRDRTIFSSNRLCQSTHIDCLLFYATGGRTTLKKARQRSRSTSTDKNIYVAVG